MTLIAGFEIAGVPMLLGDFLITTKANPSTLKKVHLIGPNLAVAWTGDRFAATPILRDLYNEFKNIHVTRESLERFLTTYKEDGPTDLFTRLVGWIVDDGPRCFRWNSGYPQQLFYAPELFDGSGDDVFEKMIKSSRLEIHGSRPSDVDFAKYFALSKSCALISDEVLDKNHQKHGFGHAYEVAYYDGEGFKFIDDILFSVWDFYFDTATKGGNYRFYPTVYKYRSFGYYSVVQTYDFESGETVFEAITPAFDDMPSLFSEIPGIDLAKATSFPLASAYYCLYFRFQASDGVSSIGSLVFPANQPELPFFIESKSGTESLGFRFDFLPVIYQQIKSAQSCDPRGQANSGQ